MVAIPAPSATCWSEEAKVRRTAEQYFNSVFPVSPSSASDSNLRNRVVKWTFDKNSSVYLW